MVVQRYQELYSQGRVEALESIENLCGLSGDGTFASQLVLDVMKVRRSVVFKQIGLVLVKKRRKV